MSGLVALRAGGFRSLGENAYLLATRYHPTYYVSGWSLGLVLSCLR